MQNGADAEAELERKKVVSNVQSLGIGQIVVGALGMVSPIYAFMLRNGRMGGALKRLDDLLWTGTIGTYMVSALASSLVVSLFLVGVGLTTQKLRPVARSLTFAHAALGFANGLYNLIVVFAITVPALLAFADAEGAVGIGGAVGGIAGGAFGGFFSLLFPALELWVMTRPGVRDVLVET
jgi:hypothetical protein